ncbi:MAG: hypothetical protein O2815_08675 [Actinomycetota bacterium]|nr:hypothetical protein [Actinomycetota bacterium]
MWRRLAQLGQRGDEALNSGPMGASVDLAASNLGYGGPSLSTMGTHASIAATAAGRIAMEASGAKPTDVAHDERDAYRQSKAAVQQADRVAQAHKKLAAGESAPTTGETQEALAAAEDPGEKERLAQEHMAMYRAKREKQTGERGPGRLKARSHQLIAALRLGKAVESSGHRSGYEGTMAESANVLGASLKRGPDGTTTLTGSGDLPREQAGGRTAQHLSMFHRSIQSLGGTLGGETGKEALLRGENTTALAKSGGGMAREVATNSAGVVADAHGASGFGSTIADWAMKVSGALVGGIGWGIGKITGLESAAKNQDNVDALRKYTGEDGGTSRAQEIEERGFRPRAQATGFNDAEAGLPSIDFAKKGESWSEAREAAAAKGHTYAAGGVRGALRGIGAGIAGAARGVWSNVKGHTAKKYRDAKKLASESLASARAKASSLSSKAKAGLSRAGSAMKHGWQSAMSRLRGPRSSGASREEEGVELQTTR